MEVVMEVRQKLKDVWIKLAKINRFPLSNMSVLGLHRCHHGWNTIQSKCNCQKAIM